MANTAPLIGGASTYANSFQPVSFERASTPNGGNYSGLIGSVLGFANGFFDRRQERKLAEQQMEWNEKMADKQNEWSLDMWNKTNEYNSPTAQVARLREAGLNPLYYSLDGTSANAFQSAQVQGYDRASMRGLANPFGAGLEGYMQMKSLAKDIELKNAQIDKTKADTSSVGLDNEFKDKTMEARVEGEKLKNDVSKESIENFKKQREVMEKDIALKIEQANTEVERQAYIHAEKILKDAEYQQLVELLPLQKLFIQAQTEAQKASAAVSWANAAYQNKLINGGYVDSIIKEAQEAARKAGYDADNAKVQKMLEQYRLSVVNGTVFAIEDLKDGETTAVSRAMDFIAGKLFQTLNITATALGAGIRGSDLGTISSSSQNSQGSSASKSSSTMVGNK